MVHSVTDEGLLYFSGLLLSADQVDWMVWESCPIHGRSCLQRFGGKILLIRSIYEGRSIYKEPVAVVFLIFEILKIQDTCFVINSISNIFG